MNRIENSARLSLKDLQEMIDQAPYLSFLQLRCTDLDSQAGTVKMIMPMRPELERAPGSRQFHGGPIASLLDTVGDFAAAVFVGGGVPTINLRVDYLRPCVGKQLTAVGMARRIGRTIIVVDAEVFSSEGRLSAVGRATYSGLLE